VESSTEFERVQTSFALQGLMRTLGARLTHATAGEVCIELPASEALSQQQGFMHAGAITSIVDSACGYAALTLAPEGADVVTAEFKINFLRPAIGERFVATGKVETAGRSLSVCRGEVVAINGNASKVIALMQATVVRVQPD